MMDTTDAVLDALIAQSNLDASQDDPVIALPNIERLIGSLSDEREPSPSFEIIHLLERYAKIADKDHPSITIPPITLPSDCYMEAIGDSIFKLPVISYSLPATVKEELDSIFADNTSISPATSSTTSSKPQPGSVAVDTSAPIESKQVKSKFSFTTASDALQSYEQQNPQKRCKAAKSLGGKRTVTSQFKAPFSNQNEMNEIEEAQKRILTNNSTSNEVNEGISADVQALDLPKNVDPKMAEVILNEIISEGLSITWDDVAGLKFVKRCIREIVVWPLLRPDLFTGIRGPPKGLLLFGPPGTGKTLLGKCIATQSGSTFFSISASCLTSKWVGDGEKMVRALFAVANRKRPAVVFIDEIDSLLSQRGSDEHESSRRLKTEFLVQLDGCATDDGASKGHLLVIGATNRPQEIDEAARRRFAKRLYVPLPDPPARASIVTRMMRDERHCLTDEDVAQIATMSEGFSGADVATLCREAALAPLRAALVSVQSSLDQSGMIDERLSALSSDDVAKISVDHFRSAFEVVRPSVDSNDLSSYLSWNQQFGSTPNPA